MSTELVPLSMEVIVSEEDLAVYIKFTGFDDVAFANEWADRMVDELPLKEEFIDKSQEDTETLQYFKSYNDTYFNNSIHSILKYLAVKYGIALQHP